ncbi:hypothetical protein EXIGLDRAFT_294271 [Exidia glandulosa HHB12029]|uniref:Uncharacterized protein n=1 Tax=Exidia glandulosa HHB12029 TaxID=1314781 RepID=A0A165DDR2_EXIGL|nr:hypothetical protein EXIGLDRAFT_294271 [Exidia glandulosa HHB12029]
MRSPAIHLPRNDSRDRSAHRIESASACITLVWTGETPGGFRGVCWCLDDYSAMTQPCPNRLPRFPDMRNAENCDLVQPAWPAQLWDLRTSNARDFELHQVIVEGSRGAGPMCRHPHLTPIPLYKNSLAK